MLQWDAGWAAEVDGDGWAHGGIAVTPEGQVLVTSPDGGRLSILDPDGRLVRTLHAPAIEAHGLTVSMVAGRPAVWIADTGWKLVVTDGLKGGSGNEHGRVFALDVVTGSVLMELEAPQHPIYRSRPYRPTLVAVDDASGGSGDIWVADGYGASLVHRYAASGRYLGHLDGESGAGRFDCPHGITIDRRGPAPRLYVADRVPHRIQVFDLDGQFDRAFGSEFLDSPSGFAAMGSYLVVAELKARLLILDEEDRVATVVGANADVVDLPGWPNREDGDGRLRRPEDLVAGRTNSPHGIAADAAGNVYLTEFLLGGRVSRLRHLDP